MKKKVREFLKETLLFTEAFDKAVLSM